MISAIAMTAITPIVYPTLFDVPVDALCSTITFFETRSSSLGSAMVEIGSKWGAIHLQPSGRELEDRNGQAAHRGREEERRAEAVALPDGADDEGSGADSGVERPDDRAERPRA